MARPKLGEGVTLRLQVLVPEEEIPAIDDWGFANRIGNRSATVRRLCAIGLEADTLRAENERLRAENEKHTREYDAYAIALSRAFDNWKDAVARAEAAEAVLSEAQP